MTMIQEYNVGEARLNDLYRRALATTGAVTLLEALQDDTLWSDSCTIAECVQDIANALGWHLGDMLADTPLDGWSYDQTVDMLRRLSNGLSGHPANEHGGEVPEEGATIALHTLKGGLTDQTAMLVLGNITRIAAAFKARDVLLRPRLHPRVLATMDAIWEAASWVGNDDLGTAEDEAVAA